MFPSSIIARQTLTPLDLERTYGLTEGNIFHGDLSLEQLFFMRPVPDGRNIEHRSTDCTFAAPERIPAAALPVRQGTTRRTKPFETGRRAASRRVRHDHQRCIARPTFSL